VDSLKPLSPTFKPIPLNIVGSSIFGRYPKISSEVTYNMIISDDWLVPYAGHKLVSSIIPNGEGRGIFPSVRYNHLILVINDGVYTMDANNFVTKVANLDSYTGDVFIAENDAHQIGICDKKDIYVFNYVANTFTKVTAATLGFTPVYLDFQDGYFIAADADQPKFHLSQPNDGTNWSGAVIGALETKPDNVVACVRLPGKGNYLLVMGRTVTELWMDVGYQLFPYQRSSSINFDYGCLNSATIACGEDFVVWVGVNEKSGPAIMFSSGGAVQQISTDGINFKLAQLKNPSKSYGFLIKQDGHLLYQLTFADKEDDFTLLYDFNTKKFSYLCNEYMDAHVAKRTAFFNDNYYFVSLKDGNLYELSSEYTTYDGAEIPRIRVCKTIRAQDNSGFVGNSVEFTIEQGEVLNKPYPMPLQDKGAINSPADFPLFGIPKPGWRYRVQTGCQDNVVGKTQTMQTFNTGDQIVWNGTNYSLITDDTTRVDISVSRDGGVSFGSIAQMHMNPLGERKNRFTFYNLGFANEMTLQFRFWGMGRFVASDGEVSIYQ
jgi:hypothetical protein